MMDPNGSLDSFRIAKARWADEYGYMSRRNWLGTGGQLDVDWLPRPRKDIDYYSDLSAEADRIKRRLDRTEIRPRPFRRADWPKRKPTLSQARVGDALAGNIELRAACSCGHSAAVDVSVIAAKFDASTRIVDIKRKARCTQCRRYGALTVSYPEQGG